MYTLIGSFTSPYVRKLRLLLTDLKINFEFKSINYLEEHDAQFLKKINQINKIPVLMIDERPLYDSRVIYNYLARQHNVSPLSLDEENYLSAIDGALDTLINLFSLRRGGLDLNTTENSYLLRQKELVNLILDYLNPWVKSLDVNNPQHWNFATMSLYSFLYWGQFRDVLDLTNWPAMTQFLDHFKNKNGIIETDIPKN